MKFSTDSAIFKGAHKIQNIWGNLLPGEYTGAREEFLASRSTAWLGVALNSTPIYDVSGPDTTKLLNYICTNRDFSKMKPGDSKHALLCNDNGHIMSDGVILYREDGSFRTYWLAPVLQYYVESSELDVHGEYHEDEYFFQIDGPKSLEILEEATQTDLHDIKFAKNKTVKICGTDMVVHILGMSGALAYEVHGDAKNAEVVYTKIREVLESFGGKALGCYNYSTINHTPGGYPNEFVHFTWAYDEAESGLCEFTRKFAPPHPISGSASEDKTAYYVTPYDIGWGYLVNFDHDFIGKEALEKIKANPPRTVVTLEWNADDVADVYSSQFRGTDEEPYGYLEKYVSAWDTSQPTVRGDYVLADGKKIGLATGRTYGFYERRMISLGIIEKEYAELGKELVVLWGNPGCPQKEIRAKVAQFPYYNGEYRNETFDTEKVPRRTFCKAEEKPKF